MINDPLVAICLLLHHEKKCYYVFLYKNQGKLSPPVIQIRPLRYYSNYEFRAYDNVKLVGRKASTSGNDKTFPTLSYLAHEIKRTQYLSRECSLSFPFLFYIVMF